MQEIIMAGVGALAGAGGCWALLAARSASASSV